MHRPAVGALGLGLQLIEDVLLQLLVVDAAEETFAQAALDRLEKKKEGSESYERAEGWGE